VPPGTVRCRLPRRLNLKTAVDPTRTRRSSRRGWKRRLADDSLEDVANSATQRSILGNCSAARLTYWPL
jgi:hypothetical protein